MTPQAGQTWLSGGVYVKILAVSPNGRLAAVEDCIGHHRHYMGTAFLDELIVNADGSVAKVDRSRFVGNR